LWATLLAALVAAGMSLLVFAPSGKAILDGTAVERAGQYPFMVALMDNTMGTIQEPFPFPKAFFCGGTLIDADSVLTAAHCVEDRREIVADSAWDFHAVVGQPKTLASGITNFGQNANAIQVRRVWLHPDWQIGSYAKGGPHKYDVAVVKLSRIVSTSLSRSAARSIPGEQPTALAAGEQPIALATRKQNGFEDGGAQAFVAGWGRTGPNGGLSPNLRIAKPKIVFDEVASSIYPRYDEALHIAAGKAFCTGDSGGPLYAEVGAKKPIQFGIAQSGPREYTKKGKCRKPQDPLSRPDVYTEVNARSIRSFITKHKAM